MEFNTIETASRAWRVAWPNSAMTPGISESSRARGVVFGCMPAETVHMMPLAAMAEGATGASGMVRLAVWAMRPTCTIWRNIAVVRENSVGDDVPGGESEV